MSQPVRTYLEIGTGDFDTLNDRFAQRAHWRGMSIEALPEHFQRLLKLPKNHYLNAVCLASEATKCDFHYVPSDAIKQHELPAWLRGCGSVDKTLQPSLRAYNEHVVTMQLPVVSISDVLKHDIFQDPFTGRTHIDLVKIDTEGYDLTLVYAILDITCPTHLIFETWGIKPEDFTKLDARLTALGYHCVGSVGDNVQYSRPSVLLIGEANWSTGSIAKDLIHLSTWDARFLDWGNRPADLDASLSEYDAVVVFCLISPTAWPELSRHGVICCGPCEMNQPWWQKLQGVQPGGCFGAVSHECYQAVLKASAGRPVYYTPATARLSRFKQHTTRKEIATLGWCGIPDSAVNFGSDLKRHSMFLEITAVTGFQPHVSGRRFTYDTMQAFYDSIDMLVCTSVSEGGPLPVFEAIACGVPVISTPVGLVNEMASIGKFQTAREAIDLVQLLRDPSVRQQYAADQYTELKSISMEGLIHYWDRFFQACSRRQPTPVFLSL